MPAARNPKVKQFTGAGINALQRNGEDMQVSVEHIARAAAAYAGDGWSAENVEFDLANDRLNYTLVLGDIEMKQTIGLRQAFKSPPFRVEWPTDGSDDEAVAEMVDDIEIEF